MRSHWIALWRAGEVTARSNAPPACPHSPSSIPGPSLGVRRGIHCCAVVDRSGEASPYDSAADRGSGDHWIPEEPIFRERRQEIPVFRRMPGNFWPRERGGHRAGAGTGPGAALLPLSQRTSDGACRYRVCEGEFPNEDAGLHYVDGSGRDEYGDGRGDGDRQPAAGSFAAGGYVCAAKCGAGIAAT